MSNVSRVSKNTFMLYLIAVVKLILPLLTMPYLTRVLSEQAYGLVSYVKNCMTYMTLIIDFGFILSSVKDIVNADGNLEKIGEIAGNTFFAKFLLSLVAFAVLIIMIFAVPILKVNVLFVMLSFVAVAVSLFLADFLFRGIEKMEHITTIFLISKSITTALTFIFVKGDSSILWVPILDIIGNTVAVVITLIIIRKLNIKLKMTGFKDCFAMIKDSFIYFLSNISATAFTAFNAFIIGIYFTDLTEVAHWSLCLNIISAIQGLYAPICNGVYPHMIKEKSLSFIHKLLAIFMPVVIIGCILCFVLAKQALFLLGGEKYVEAYTLFRWMIPILFFSFPVQIYGWPTLGAIGKQKQNTITLIIAAIAQVLGIFLLIFIKQFNLISLAILRWSTELIMLIARVLVVYKNKKYFVSKKNKSNI